MTCYELTYDQVYATWFGAKRCYLSFEYYLREQDTNKGMEGTSQMASMPWPACESVDHGLLIPLAQIRPKITWAFGTILTFSPAMNLLPSADVIRRLFSELQLTSLPADDILPDMEKTQLMYLLLLLLGAASLSSASMPIRPSPSRNSSLRLPSPPRHLD